MKHLIDRYHSLLHRMQNAGMTTVNNHVAMLLTSLANMINCVDEALEHNCDPQMIQYMESETMKCLDQMEEVVDKEIKTFTERKLMVLN